MSSAITVLEVRSDAVDNAETRTGHTTFSYDQLASDVAEKVQQSTDRIHERIKRASEEIFPIGRELNRVKNVLPHGTFLAWIELEFGWSQRTAQRYMQAAEVFGDKSDIVSVLGPTAIYGLSARSTPQSFRDEVVARLESGERPGPQAVLEQVKAARQEARARSASDTSEPQADEQQIDQTTVSQVCDQGEPSQDQQVDSLTPARRAVDLIFEQFEHGRDELACFLEEADAEELRRHLLQGCSG